MRRNLQYKSLCWHCHCWKKLVAENNLHWTQRFSLELTRKRRWATKHSKCSLLSSPWRNTGNYPWRTVGPWFIASWLVSRCNVSSLWSFVDWFVATPTRSITLLYKRRIHSFKILYPGPAETVRVSGRWIHKISLLSKCSNQFPTNAKISSFSLAQKSLSGFLRMHNKSPQRKLGKHKKTARGNVLKQRLVTIAKKKNLEAKKTRSVFRKMIATKGSHYTSRH